MKKPRRIRISCFHKDAVDLSSSPIKHHACKSSDRADALYSKYIKAIGGLYGRVVMHEGNLRRSSYRILRQQPEQPPYLDQLTYTRTSFASFEALLNADGGYFPSLNVSIGENLTLAIAYDHMQALRGDSRRALRWGAIFHQDAA